MTTMTNYKEILYSSKTAYSKEFRFIQLSA